MEGCRGYFEDHWIVRGRDGGRGGRVGERQCCPLSFVNVRAPVHCLFNMPCAVVASTDSFATIDASSLVWQGTANLQSRTFKVTFGAPIGEKEFYEYRVEMTQTITSADAADITDLSIDFGSVGAGDRLRH